MITTVKAVMHEDRAELILNMCYRECRREQDCPKYTHLEVLQARAIEYFFYSRFTFRDSRVDVYRVYECLASW